MGQSVEMSEDDVECEEKRTGIKEGIHVEARKEEKTRTSESSQDVCHDIYRL